MPARLLFSSMKYFISWNGEVWTSIAGTIARSAFSTVQIRGSCFENEKSITTAAD